MVGPSSSHTAGACKIGQFARALFNKKPTKVTFYLHGSFAEVYKGHATDRALLGGVLKFRTSDPRIKNAFKIAEEKGLKYEFIEKDLGKDAHPNTVQIVLENSRNKMSVIGSSIGGGMVEITKLNEFNLNLHGRAGKYLSLLIMHDNNNNSLKKLIDEIEKLDISVVNTETDTIGKKSLSIVSMEGRRIKVKEVVSLEKIEGIDFVRSLSKLENK